MLLISRDMPIVLEEVYIEGGVVGPYGIRRHCTKPGLAPTKCVAAADGDAVAAAAKICTLFPSRLLQLQQIAADSSRVSRSIYTT